MRVYDISWTISDRMTVYKDKAEKKPRIVVTRTLAQGANESRLTLDAHTGTHVDAQKHMLEGESIDLLDLHKLIGPCVVLEFMQHDVITRKDLESKNIPPGSVVLLKTRNSKQTETDKFDMDFCYLDADGAEYLVQKNIRAAGFDGLGIERSQQDHKTHIALLSAGIPIIEGLRLSPIDPGEYEFVCLPLKIQDGDGAPARAILIKR